MKNKCVRKAQTSPEKLGQVAAGGDRKDREAMPVVVGYKQKSGGSRLADVVVATVVTSWWQEAVVGGRRLVIVKRSASSS